MLTFKSVEKQITLYNLGGPRSIVEGLKRKRFEVLRKKEFCLQTAFGLKLQQLTLTWVFGLPARLPYKFPTCKLPQTCKPIPQTKSLYTYIYNYNVISIYIHILLIIFPWRTTTNNIRNWRRDEGKGTKVTRSQVPDLVSQWKHCFNQIGI